MTSKLEEMAEKIIGKTEEETGLSLSSERDMLSSHMLEMGRAVIAALEEQCDVDIKLCCHSEGWGQLKTADDAARFLRSLDKPDAKPTEGGE